MFEYDDYDEFDEFGKFDEFEDEADYAVDFASDNYEEMEDLMEGALMAESVWLSTLPKLPTAAETGRTVWPTRISKTNQVGFRLLAFERCSPGDLPEHALTGDQADSNSIHSSLIRAGILSQLPITLSSQRRQFP